MSAPLWPPVGVGLLYLTPRSEVDLASVVIDVEPGDRISRRFIAIGGREVHYVEIVRAWSYPHPSHRMDPAGRGHCLGCGWRLSPESLRVKQLDEPCSSESGSMSVSDARDNRADSGQTGPRSTEGGDASHGCRDLPHNAGVVGSSPTPAIDEPITYEWLARIVLRCGTQNGTLFGRPFVRDPCRFVELRGELLPPVALVAARRVSAVARRHHLHDRVPQLTCHELVRPAGADGANRVEVPRVVQATVRDAERDETSTVCVADRLPIQPAEQSLAGRQRIAMFLNVRPRPFGDAHDTISRVCSSRGIRLVSAQRAL
jgi:hypothetical protein